VINEDSTGLDKAEFDERRAKFDTELGLTEERLLEPVRVQPRAFQL
jgi:hypothetical protein